MDRNENRLMPSDRFEALLEAVDARKSDLLDGLFRILKINSERSEPQPGAPYGQGARLALEQTLDLAGSLGFETETVADQVGIARYTPPGVDPETPYIGIVGHLDVVPAEGTWTTPPYSPTLRDNRIYARGALDNKGPILACLYALRAILDTEPALKRPVWILFGTNEETGMNDIPVYLEHKAPPVAGFTPDCKYPAVYAERGRAVYTIEFESPESAASWHQAHPDEASLDLALRDPEFGLLQLRNWKQDGNRLSVSASYPPSVTPEEIESRIRRTLSSKQTVHLESDWKPVFFAKDSTLCRILKDAYETITEEDGTPVTTTGGTYAKRMPNIVPFGPSFPGQKGIAHLPDEWMDVDDLMQNMRIYALAIAGLACTGEGLDV